MAKVLLVVNDGSAARPLRRALQRAGHEVLMEYDGRAATALLEHKPVDCIICDPVLPGAFGTELISAARVALKRPDLPAILLRPLPEPLSYALCDAEPVRVLIGTYSGDEVVTTLHELGLGPRKHERRRVPHQPYRVQGRRSTDLRPPDPPSDRSKR